MCSISNDRIIRLHQTAATHGNVGLLRFLETLYQQTYLFCWNNKGRTTLNRQKHPTWLQGRNLVCATAALHGNLNILRVARCEYDFPWDETTCANAALHGHWEILKFSYQQKCPWDEQTRKNAEAFRGPKREKIVKWLNQRGCHITQKRYMDDDDRHEEYYNYMYLRDEGYY